MDPDKIKIKIVTGTRYITIKDPMYQLVPTGPSDFVIEGEVVFAGYGIKSDKYKYNDFDRLNTEGKILIVMERAP